VAEDIAGVGAAGAGELALRVGSALGLELTQLDAEIERDDRCCAEGCGADRSDDDELPSALATNVQAHGAELVGRVQSEPELRNPGEGSVGFFDATRLLGELNQEVVELATKASWNL